MVGRFLFPHGHTPPPAFSEASLPFMRDSCEFQAKLDTDSSATWTVIPTEAGHRFQGKLDSWKR